MRYFPKGISKTRKPAMTNVRGRSWQRSTVVLPCGKKVGTYFYFQLDGESDWRCGLKSVFGVRRGWFMSFNLKAEPA